MTSATDLTERNRAVVRGLYDAAISGDLPGALEVLADDIVVHEPEFLPYGGVYRGKQEFAELFGKIAQFLDLSRVTVHYYVADGERVIAVLGIPDLGTGELTHFAEQSTVRDGRIAEMRLFYYDPQSMIDAPKLD
ncbi:nuclear transport factor 2 family protein [Pseudonocardia eucalypti]|uniref:Nuclear transport factor 2 family protein n=1 Tax=Pseudonocardia eucalypti TaxID=648755 RepID=A0ABP9PXI4_9PSEU|nr:ketosteroid isomerase-like protein [Pseudonocardia eucalypti]